MDFSRTLIRSSATGIIMTDPKEKEAKLRGELSVTAKKYLINTYIKEKYGREKDINTKQMTKGTKNEENGITLLSRYKKKFLKKNELQVSNDFQCGHPDIFEGESINKATYIIDTKLSWDIWSFLPNILDTLDKGYWWQLQSYFALTGALEGEVSYVLTDTPPNLIESEKRKLLYNMDVISEESPEYIEASAALEINMIYPDIPIEEKILLFPVTRDDEAIERINNRVVKCREFLQWFSEKHTSFNKK